MASKPPAVPSPQARRQAQIQALQAALASRDAQAIERLLGQWVHRQGVNQVHALHQELAAADPQGWAWWQEQQNQPIPEPVPAPAPVVAVKALPEQAQLPRASASRPAPAPSHPAVVQLRAWLPDREGRRAA
ncbi:MAG: hypothetical protein KXJ49_02195 [Vulcanococcus sp.]|uniref:hypothetical protein n=1 Tax=Vulcanococcus sp. TaxID=2856995 RepID=UPI0025FDC8AF|nr:hypothetical protein [Vulcanococcus sp.]MBW0166293.1 hypothetical protein [Vulcanococcus sp.]